MLKRSILSVAIAVAAAAGFGFAGRADELPAIDMTAVLDDETGGPAKDVLGRAADDPDCARCPVLTLGHAAAHALFATFPDEKDLPPDQKWARAVLAARIKDAKSAHLDAEETAVIKRLLGKAYGGVVLLQAYPLLDPNAKPPGVR